MWQEAALTHAALIPKERPDKGPHMLKKRFAEEPAEGKEKKEKLSRRIPAYVMKATQQTT
jgi:hypothetical protein